MSWDVMAVCPRSHPAEDVNKGSNTSPEADSPSAGYKEDSEVSATDEGPSVVTIALIVTGVLLLCAVGGGLIVATVMKRRRNRPATPKEDDVYAPGASNTSLHLYEVVGEWPSHFTDQTYADVGVRPSYLTVLP
jgi:hypothetical protein